MRNLFKDSLSGIAVFILALPLSLGIAHASGVPLFSGIISAVIGGILVGVLSKSNLSVSGPAAGLTAVVLSGISDLGSFQAFLCALVLAGLIQIFLGVLRAGTLSAYFPSSVVNGMMAAIGVILIIKQLPHLIGYDIEEFGVEEFGLTAQDLNESYSDPHERTESNSFTVLIHSLSNLRLNVLWIGLISLSVIVLWEWYGPKKLKQIPSSLLGVICGLMANSLFGDFLSGGSLSKDHLVQLPNLNSGTDLMNYFIFPKLEELGNYKVWLLGVTVAFVASIETLLGIEAVDRMDPAHRKTPTSRELIAQGSGNLVCGLTGGLPLTSVIVRSSVNISSGARTKLSTIIHGVLIFLGVVFFVNVLNAIPLSSLAAVLIFNGFKLAAPKNFKAMYKKGIYQFVPFLVTIVAILLSDLLIGVVTGIATSLIFVLKEDHQTAIVRVENFGKFRRIVLGENLGFFHKARIQTVLDELPEGIILEIDGTRTLHLDQDIAELIHEFRRNAERKNIKVVLGGIPNMKNDIASLQSEMEEKYTRLLKNNRDWVKERTDIDPDFFSRQADGQTPQVLFIGCSDSRVPVNVITKTDPGEIFVTRNIANVVSVDDMSLFSVLQFGIEVLNVKHIIVCGHYGCGGAKAALLGRSTGLIDNWITHIKDVYLKHRIELDGLSEEQRERRLIELNVIEQVINLYKTSLIQSALKKYGFPKIHGWVYDVCTGLVKEIDYKQRLKEELDGVYGYEM
ncbi:sulfate permease [Leptospira perolatii]|uniref:Carbonic anhydrase 2 n=1 Tax=Leptospira perolatii TaxID=2023191 RepID=A0A2M9ZTI1_9LEPT|nr:sulfate permease [Leptospira perolatii]PJZ75223.1 sulfate permease [Leptospira perolatii]